MGGCEHGGTVMVPELVLELYHLLVRQIREGDYHEMCQVMAVMEMLGLIDADK